MRSFGGTSLLWYQPNNMKEARIAFTFKHPFLPVNLSVIVLGEK